MNKEGTTIVASQELQSESWPTPKLIAAGSTRVPKRLPVIPCGQKAVE